MGNTTLSDPKAEGRPGNSLRGLHARPAALSRAHEGRGVLLCLRNRGWLNFLSGIGFGTFLNF